MREKTKKWTLANPNRLNLWRANNKNKIKIHDQNYWKKHREKITPQRNLYREKNKNKLRIYHRNYMRQRYRNDIKFRIDMNFGNLIYKSIVNKNNLSWKNIVPYSQKELMRHLEKQFTDRMGWNNYGKYWEIDHIIPRAAFNYTNYKHMDFQRCWSLKNLRPLEASKNRKKGSKLEKPFQPSLAL